MTLANDPYTYRVTWSEEDREHVGLCLELPSLSWLAKTAEGALRGIRRVVAEVVADLEAEREVVPPDAHHQLAAQAAEAGGSLNRLASAKLRR